jgi:hypothetical protein
MTLLRGIEIGATARALVAALAIGGALVSLAPSEAAYAARGRSTDNGDAGTSDAPRPTTTPATRKNINDYPKCTVVHPDGSIEFFVPLDTYVRDGKTYICTADGTWILQGPPRPTSDVKVTGGGVYTSTP